MSRNKVFAGLAFASAFTSTVMPCAAFAESKSFLIGNFDELVVEGDVAVKFDNMKPPSAKAVGDSVQILALKVIRNGRVLRIRLQNDGNPSAKAAAAQPVEIVLNGRDVRKISVDGSARLDVNHVRVPNNAVTIKLNGPGQINIEKLESDRLDLALIGTGSVGIGTGQVRSARFVTNGSGKIDAPKLMLAGASLMQAGSAATHLLSKGRVDISNSGSGTITVDGEATCNIRQPGSAKILCGKTAK